MYPSPNNSYEEVKIFMNSCQRHSHFQKLLFGSEFDLVFDCLANNFVVVERYFNNNNSIRKVIVNFRNYFLFVTYYTFIR